MSEQSKKLASPLPAYRVFVSSTYSDMVRYRDSMRDAINNANCLSYGMERFGANSIPPLEKCYEELMDCQIYVCAIGMRYGSIDEQTQKSYTQLEYEKAESLGIPILAFLIDESKTRFSIDEIDLGDSAVKLAAFKNKIKSSKTVTCDFFESGPDLKGKVYRAIINEIERQKAREEDKKGTLDAYIEGAKLFKKFVKRPAQYRNQEAILRVRFDGKYGGWRLKEQLFYAFGFRPGYALYLNDLYTLGTSPDVSESIWSVDCFADGKAADWLDDNDVNQGTIIEGRFKLAYELVRDIKEGNQLLRSNHANDIYMACLVLLEGLHVISRDVPINPTQSNE